MKHVLPTIVLAQFLCTTLWFVGNAVMPDVISIFGLDPLFFATQTSAVQLGFISGTLLFALLSVADRFSPSRVFFLSAVAAAACNLGLLVSGDATVSILLLRTLTGFFLAGIYPVGMKIASDYFDKGLGKSLGFLVGALVLGTAFPHLLRGYLTDFPWEYIITTSSCLALLGGVLILLLVPDGPYRKQAGKVDLSSVAVIFRVPGFRSAALGYFGHMWELYAFWSFIPLWLTIYRDQHTVTDWSIPVLSFVVIGVGCFACIGAGYLSTNIGERMTAALALAASGACCLLSPLFIQINSPIIFLCILIFWGIMVVADSPMFSTLIARNIDPVQRGTALTITNCIGFAITIASIETISWLTDRVAVQYLFVFLAIGPVLGLIALFRGSRNENHPPSRNAAAGKPTH
jgi:MFS family permease